MPSYSCLALSLVFDSEELILWHVELCYHYCQSINVPEIVLIYPWSIIPLIAWGPSHSILASHSLRERSVKVNQNYLHRRFDIDDYIFWFEVTMHIAQVVQFLQAGNHLEQYLI
jgi:hypothetical protein